MQVAAENPKMVTHLILINPRSGASKFGDAINDVIALGKRNHVREIEKGGQNILIGEKSGRPLYEPADSAEAGGLSRALENLRFADPTDPAVGSFDYLYEDGDSAQTLADTTWRAIDFWHGDKPRLPAMIIMGTKSPWTPKGDMQKVASLFPGSSVVEFKDCAEFPFMFEPYKFNTAVRKFLYKANKSLKASAKRRKGRR
jgi:pimeloyl-ACP methyl ester carboxylesterase